MLLVSSMIMGGENRLYGNAYAPRGHWVGLVRIYKNLFNKLLLNYNIQIPNCWTPSPPCFSSKFSPKQSATVV